MRLATWTALRGRGSLKWLERATKALDPTGRGVCYTTLHKAARSADHRLTYAKARLIERATDGAVTTDELCGGPELENGDMNGDTQAQ